MPSTIKIGLTYTGSEQKHNNYVNWLKKDDPEIEIIKLSAADNNLELVQTLDGIVISGGVDIHPKEYGSTIFNYANAPAAFDEARDQFEKNIYAITRQQGIPLLGICRGMQLVNCILGGTLTHDMGDALNATHRFDETDKLHEIHIEPGTLLYNITAKEKELANSAHHQCIDSLGKDLAINCTSGCGIIEGVEWANGSNKSFFLGVQWHPERMYQHGLEESPLSKNIRDKFLEAVNINKQKQ
jgi:putative glutamine amidotransferase